MFPEHNQIYMNEGEFNENIFIDYQSEDYLENDFILDAELNKVIKEQFDSNKKKEEEEKEAQNDEEIYKIDSLYYLQTFQNKNNNNVISKEINSENCQKTFSTKTTTTSNNGKGPIKKFLISIKIMFNKIIRTLRKNKRLFLCKIDKYLKNISNKDINKNSKLFVVI